MKYIVIILFSFFLFNCSTLSQMENDIDEGFYKAQHRLPEYNIVIVPTNQAAIDRELKKGNVWIIPDKHRTDYKEVE